MDPGTTEEYQTCCSGEAWHSKAVVKLVCRSQRRSHRVGAFPVEVGLQWPSQAVTSSGHLDDPSVSAWNGLALQKEEWGSHSPIPEGESRGWHQHSRSEKM